MISGVPQFKITLGELLPDISLNPAIQNIEVKSVSLDSRSVDSSGLFIALSGNKTHGRKYIHDAIEKGAAAILCENESFSLDYVNGKPVIGITALQQKVGSIAARFYHDPSGRIQVIGITGTNGKSTCVSLIAQIFNQLNIRAGIIGTLGYGLIDQKLNETGLTTPDAITCQKILHEMAHNKVEVVAMEVSSHAIAQNRIEGIKFYSAVFTNLSRDHLDYHSSFDEYGETKARLFENSYLSYCVINADDDFGVSLLNSKMPEAAEIIRVSSVKSDVEVYAKSYTLDDGGIVANIVTPWGENTITSSLIGEFNLSNLLISIAAVCSAGAKFEKVIDTVPALHAVEGRMEKVKLDSEIDKQNEQETEINDISVFIDYAHTPDALERALKCLSAYTANNLWVVFGCGGDRDKGKRSEMGAIAEKLADKIVITSDNPRSEDPAQIIRDIEAGMANGNHITIISRHAAIHFALDNAKPGDCILIAGKGHEKYQIINGEKLHFDDYQIAKAAMNDRDRNVSRELK